VNGSIKMSTALSLAGQGPWLDVTAYSAIPNCTAPFSGCFPLKDQTANIQSAIDACAGFTSSNQSPSGCTIFFPMGSGTTNGAYYIHGGLHVQRPGGTPSALNGVPFVEIVNAGTVSKSVDLDAFQFTMQVDR
jgi:hypothetical protein